MRALFRYRAVIGATMLIVAGCANQIPPDGGPMDDRGPVIIATVPEPFVVNFHGDEVQFEFDEYVDQRSFEESVFISPAIPNVEFDWSGHTATMHFPDGLRDSTTYVITVGTDVVDLEPSRRNRMEHAFTFAFSTGSQIDRGLLAGRVYGVSPADDPSGIMVLAYNLRSGRRDTLNPQTTLPEYVTQTGKDGTFQLPHIRLGAYGLMALKDEYRNMFYEREIDAYAVQSGPVVLTEKDTAVSGIVLQMAREDTTGPRFTKVDALDRNHLLVTFSEEVDTSRGRAPIMSIIDSLTRKKVTIFLTIPDAADFRVWSLITDYLTPNAGYLASVERVFDRSGNPGIPGTLTQRFTGPEKVDTLRPRISAVSLRDSARDVQPDVAIRISFSQPMQEEHTLDRPLAFEAQAGPPVPAVARWATPAVLEISPSRPLLPFTWYALRLPVSGWVDWKNVVLQDSMLQRTFATLDPESEGSIEGVVVDPSVSDTSGPVIVDAIECGTKPAKIHTVRADRSGRFSVASLPPGQFVLSAFRDRNGNGVFDPGLPLPYHPSERRSGLTDTLKVRPRWPLEGVRFMLPK